MSVEELPIFTDFVDRVLRLGGNSTVNKFSLHCGFGTDPDDVQLTRWISNVLERGVSYLDLRVLMDSVLLPSNIFNSKSLVSLRIVGRVCRIYVEDVHLPKLKTLHLINVMIGKSADCFDKLISGCRVLEELDLHRNNSSYMNLSVSSKTLKTLGFGGLRNLFQYPECISFDTPNLVYLEYFDYVAHKYPKVKFGSLVEAKICLILRNFHILVRDASDFFMGLRNVQILHLHADTLEVLAFYCKAIPVFRCLTHLTIDTRSGVGWESLPRLLKNCPNLETLFFRGLDHKYSDKCGDVDGCLCRNGEEVRPCLSSSPLKVLKIRLYNGATEINIDQIKYFLETMPHLEQLIVGCCPFTSDLSMEISNQIKNLPRLASPNCEIQVVEVL